ncbi:MAG TPA: hypothetical protein VLW75_00295 [Rhizomicrobium sp.]|nr:hypothetical protein [Rhizomicrobium sp.]
MTAQDPPNQGLADEPREFARDAKLRFAPADNLYDAIRSDVSQLGEYEFQPLTRQCSRDLPFFNDPDYYDQE